MTGLGGLAAARARKAPGALAYAWLDRDAAIVESRSYAQLAARAGAVAAALAGRARPGEPVLLLHPPGLAFLEALLGCFSAGVTAVPALLPHPLLSKRAAPRLREIADDARPRLALTEPSALERARELLPDKRLAWLTGGEESDAPPARRAPSRVALIQYTSGTGGRARGVPLSHANLLHNLEAVRRAAGHGPGSRVVSWLPHSHDMGLVGGLLQPLYAGCPGYLLSPFDFLLDPACWPRALSRHGGTSSPAPDFAYELCARRADPAEAARLDLSRWDMAFIGAETVRHETLERFAAAFAPAGFRREAFFPCYGLAESTLMVTGARKGRAPRVDAGSGAARVSCGRPVPGLRLLVVDPRTRVPLGEGRVGELWVRGPSVAAGYHRRAALTRRLFRARAKGRAGAWLRTGDLGFLRGGELYVTGRLKDVIVLNGVKHHPEELEAAVERACAFVRPRGCAAFAVEEGGRERLVLALELDRKARAGGSRPELARAAREALMAGRQVAAHEVVFAAGEGLPRTPSGKLRRAACREAYLAGRLERAP